MMITKDEYVRAYIDWQEAELRRYEEWSFDECLRLRAKYHRIRDAYYAQEQAIEEQDAR